MFLLQHVRKILFLIIESYIKKTVQISELKIHNSLKINYLIKHYILIIFKFFKPFSITITFSNKNSKYRKVYITFCYYNNVRER